MLNLALSSGFFEEGTSLEIAARRAQQTHVDGMLFAASKRPHAAFLENAEELRL